MNLKGRNFLTLKDFTPEEILYLLDLSAELKAKKKAEIDEKKNALRAEDIQKGVFIRIGDMAKKEPTFRKAAI